jgi:hypothetical protein
VLESAAMCIAPLSFERSKSAKAISSQDSGREKRPVAISAPGAFSAISFPKFVSFGAPTIATLKPRDKSSRATSAYLSVSHILVAQTLPGAINTKGL